MMVLSEDDVIQLTNQAKRKAVLDAWKAWPLWVTVPEIGLIVHKLDVPCGRSFTAAWYEGDKPESRWTVNQHVCLHLIGADGKLAHGSQGESILIEELRAARKKILEVRNERHGKALAGNERTERE